MHTAFFDGSANPNPGKVGLGFVILADGKEVGIGACPLPFGTNNEAEYEACIWLLENALKAGFRTLSVFGDSKLVINQINGTWQAGKESLQKKLEKVNQLKAQFAVIEFQWCRRNKNQRADALSKRALTLDIPQTKWKSQQSQTANHTAELVHTKSTQQHPAAMVIDKPPQLKQKVQSIGNGFFTISRTGSEMVVLDSRRKRCTCAHFREHQHCEHVSALENVAHKQSPQAFRGYRHAKRTAHRYA